MSMPEFPDSCSDITQEQAFNMLLGSIAMEELALSHIINAEGEKLQYLLGTLHSGRTVCTTPKEVLEANKSISDLLEKVAFNQILLKGKLSQVLEAKEKCRPPRCEECRKKPDCCVINSCSFLGEWGCWGCGCALPWKPCGEQACGICRQGASPGVIHLGTTRPYAVSFSLLLRGCTRETVRLAMQVQERNMGPWSDFITWENQADAGGELPISGCTVLPGADSQRTIVAFRLCLLHPEQVMVERGRLNLTLL